MVAIAPFRGLTYDPDVAGPIAETSAAPYDALDRYDFARHREANPYTVVQLITPDADAGFASARRGLDRWLRTGVLREDPEEALYLYEEHELRQGVPHVQRGWVATVELDDVGEGLLLHESVDADRAAQRARRLREVPLDLTPVVAVHPDVAALDPLVDAARAQPPVIAFTDEGSIDHRVWRVTDPALVAAVVAAFRGVTAVLADGHHRVAAARALRGRDDAAGERTLVWLVPASAGPEIRPIHRLVRGGVEDPAAALAPAFRRLPWRGGAAELAAAIAEAPGLDVGLVTRHGRAVLRARDPAALRRGLPADRGAAWRALDMAVVEEAVLPALAPDSVIATPDVAAADELVTSGRASCLLLVAPPTLAQVTAVAAEGEVMPPRSTWFRPKPRAGLVMRRMLADAAAGS